MHSTERERYITVYFDKVESEKEEKRWCEKKRDDGDGDDFDTMTEETMLCTPSELIINRKINTY